MNPRLNRFVIRPLALAGLALSLTACQSNSGLGSMVNSGSSLFQQLGGMNTVMQLVSVFMQSSSQDSQLSGLLAGADRASLTGQVANQLCASLGGGCKAPLTSEQISAGAKELTSAQSQAISSNLDTALASAVSSPALRQVAGQVVSPQLGGILGALL
jgi:hypothetical protein